MSTDIRVVLPNRQGVAMMVLEALAAADINVDGVCADLRTGENWGYLHVLVGDEHEEKVTATVEELGFEVTAVRDVDVIPLEDAPGALAIALRRYSEAGRNIDVMYVASNNRIVVGTEDMHPEKLGVKMSET